MALERDPDFWIGVAGHPQVAPYVLFGHSALSVGDVVQHPRTRPFRSEHGGYLLIQLDGLGKVYELHSLFTPEGWGREASSTAKYAFTTIFEEAALVVTYQVEDNPRSKPPVSFGFRPAGEFTDSPEIGRNRTWYLTREAWNASPVRRRQCH